MLLEKARNDPLFERPTLLLTLGGENLRNRARSLPLDLAIGIDEGEPQPVGNTCANRRFSRTHRPDEYEPRSPFMQFGSA